MSAFADREAERRAWLETLEPKMVDILDGAVLEHVAIAEDDLDAAIDAARTAFHERRQSKALTVTPLNRTPGSLDESNGRA
jgi:hypothetical protein